MNGEERAEIGAGFGEVTSRVDALASRFESICKATAELAEDAKSTRADQAEDSERIAKVEVHTEHLVAGQDRIETKLDELLVRKSDAPSSGTGRRFTLFGAGALAAVAAVVGPFFAWLDESASCGSSATGSNAPRIMRLARTASRAGSAPGRREHGPARTSP